MNPFRVFEATECSVASKCKNSIATLGPDRAHCVDCRLAPGNEQLRDSHWRALNPRDRHPVLEEEKRNKSRGRVEERKKKRASVDRGRRAVVKRAVRSEAAAVRNLNVTPTANSGRKFKDADMVGADMITLDNKDQSNRENPVVNMAELVKVQADARRAGKPIGGLILRNKFGVGVVVIPEADFAMILAHLNSGD